MDKQDERPLLKGQIMIAKLEEGLTTNGRPRVILADEHKTHYTIWKNKKDGTISKAYTSIKERSVGETIDIGYKESAYVDENKVDRVSKNIVFLSLASTDKEVPSDPFDSPSQEDDDNF